MSNAQDICSQIDYLKYNVKDPQASIDSIENMIARYAYDSLSPPEWDMIYFKHSYSYLKAGQYEYSLELGLKYLKWLDKVHYWESVGDYYNTIATCYYYQGETDSAAHYFVLSADDLRAKGKDFYYAAVINNIGVIYLGVKDYSKAIAYYRKAKDAFLAIGDSTYLASVLGNIGYCYYELRQIDSSNYYSTAAIDVGLKTESNEGYFNGLMTLGDLAVLSGDTLAGSNKYRQVYKEAMLVNYDDYKYRAAQSLANTLKDEKLALKYAKEAYEYTLTSSGLLEESFMLTLAHLLRKNNEGEQAYDLVIPRYYEKDSLLQAKYENQKLDLLAKYESAEKERLILTQKNELTQRDLEINRLLLGLISLLLLGVSLLVYVLYQKNNTDRKQQEYEKRFAQLETMVLKSQMNPHFIFNSLNSIRYLFMKDEKEKGIKYITKFAKLLRNTLHHGEDALVSLADEIELTELFIDLEQLRFDDQFTFEHDYDDAPWAAVQIPPFVVQPLVENAFWHGLSPSTSADKRLKVSIQKIANSYIVQVIDNGVGYGVNTQTLDLEVNKKKSYGLSILRERFELINKTQPMQYELTVLPAPDFATGTCVQISITPTAL